MELPSKTKQDVNKNLNIFLRFSDKVTPLTVKNNFKILLGSKPDKFKNIEVQ